MREPTPLFFSQEEKAEIIQRAKRPNGDFDYAQFEQALEKAAYEKRTQQGDDP